MDFCCGPPEGSRSSGGGGSKGRIQWHETAHSPISLRAENDLGRTYNNALVGVESNNHGHSCLNTLINVLEYPNLFYEKNEKGVPGPGRSGKVGYSTNAKTRQVMLDDLELDLREGNIVVRDLSFLIECMSFKLQSDGSYGADPGAHDDKVIYWAIARQMLKYHRHKARVILL